MSTVPAGVKDFGQEYCMLSAFLDTLLLINSKRSSGSTLSRMAKAGDADIRISNMERDEAISTLGVHMSTGRLELDEYEERCSRAAAARWRGELEVLFGDLPAPHPDLSSATPPTPLVRKAGQLVTDPRGKRKKEDLQQAPVGAAMEVVGGLSLIVGIPAAILLTIIGGHWWVFIPVVIVFGVAASIAEATKKPKTDS